jgi:outer membrane receptor protein involved in Fe transport
MVLQFKITTSILSVLNESKFSRGPASVLYGQFEPGGVVNYVTKQPLATPYRAGEFTVGNYDFYRSSLDVSGPLTPDKNLLYRLNVAYENSGNFVDFVDVDNGLKMPLGDRVLNSFTPLHYGTFGGLPTRILYVFVGLAPLILFLTGFLMYLYRYWTKPSRRDSAMELSQKL